MCYKIMKIISLKSITCNNPTFQVLLLNKIDSKIGSELNRLIRGQIDRQIDTWVDRKIDRYKMSQK